MNRFQRWALVTTLATYLAIIGGGLVRAADAGLGCPDWPTCFGRLHPPIKESQIPNTIDGNNFDISLAWIEYTNRFIGVIIGLLILATMYFAWRLHRRDRQVLYPTIAAFVLVLFQGWLGGVLVKYELEAWHITLHFFVALVIVALLLYATVEAFFPNRKPFAGLAPQRRRLAQLTLLVFGLTLVQTILGTEIRGQLELVEKNFQEMARADWIGEVNWIDPVHRSFSWLILLGVGWINIYIYQHTAVMHRWLRWIGYSAGVMVIFQIIAGIWMVYGGFPAAFQVVHLSVGSFFVGVLLMLYLLAGRLGLDEQKDSVYVGQQQATLQKQKV